MKMMAGAAILAAYAALTALNMSVSLDPLLATWESHTGGEKGFLGLPKALEKVADENIYGKEYIINIYSFIHVLLGKNEIDNFEIIKDLDGKGHFPWFQPNVWIDPVIFGRIKALKEKLPGESRLIALLPLDKNVRGYTRFARGLPDNRNNEIMDAYKAELQKMGIDSLDLRESWKSSGIEYEKLFYTSDHHWRIETVFWGFTELARFMHDMYAFPAAPFYLNKDNYNTITYEKSFVGFILEKTGFPFSEVDDFTLLYPKFPTDYIFTIHRERQQEPSIMRGRFERIFYFRPDKYGYGSILGGMQPIRHIQNMNNPDAPKALFITDSFGWPLIAFFSTLCSDTWIIDPRIYNESYSKLIEKTKPDYVFILFASLRIDLFTEAMEK
jgi:hypothetical protein